MDDIRAWLKSPVNYEQGAKIFLQHSKNMLLRKVFSEPVSDFKRKKLVEEMRNLLSKKKDVATKTAVAKEQAVKVVASSERQWPDELDAVLQALHTEWKAVFAEMMNLSARIYDVALAGEVDSAKKVEAGIMAHRILDLDDECETYYRKRDFYIENKRMPEEKKLMELVVDPKKIPMALLSAQRYVRDYKNKLSKNAADVNAASQLAKWEWAVGEYKKQLTID